ncbi:hypothetical protein BU14_2990s0001 [Porphyra umbilicalis]|uniref:Uncharacterized protein n=1 Tax=Porphyra umbilicalis TaxID=2786 RepID=A0A1X6NI82_PORUM|nr:hypothetical protein BU14_2990s0001 [Porphyra umbilicalis]|eukprot:OSX68331.1 hypothetical protein BU14_2990s0001 [Porphyra umbilicalis]
MGTAGRVATANLSAARGERDSGSAGPAANAAQGAMAASSVGGTRGNSDSGAGGDVDGQTRRNSRRLDRRSRKSR